MSRHASQPWLVITILIAASLIAFGLVKTRPRAVRRPPKIQIPVVSTMPLERTTTRASLPIMGTVLPATRVSLKARVSGDIVSVHPKWFPGGTVKKGEILLVVDHADYRIALAQTQAEHAQAESELLLEKGRQDVAAREWELLGPEDGGSEMDRTLALRAPQLAAATARVAAAAARVERAELDLARTQLRAPFNAIILERQVHVGDQITPALKLAELADIDQCHIRAPLPVARLPHISLPSATNPGATATARWPNGTTRSGEVIALLGDLEARGSMAQLLIAVPLEAESHMLFGSYVELTILGKTLPPAFRIPRRAMMDGGRVLILTAENTLRIAQTTTLLGERDHVICDVEVTQGETLIISGLAAPVEGMKLNTAHTVPAEKAAPPANKKKEAPQRGQKAARSGEAQ
jgi:RND family efflux transporter MFP subunit